MAERTPLPTDGNLPRASNYSERSGVYLYRCMRKRGWEVRLLDDFTLEENVPPEQQAANLVDSNACQEKFRREFPPAAMTAERAKQLYALELTTAECLAAHGHPQNSEPISEQRYVEEYLTSGAPSWTAYNVVTSADGALERACPQPGDVMVQR